MPIISTHKQVQALRRLPFCYACGSAFGPHDKRDRDHIPPEACFATEDRDFPLVLPSHVSCNQAHNLIDDQVAQLVSLLRGKRPSERSRKLNIQVVPSTEGAGFVAKLEDLNLQAIIWRWVKGFHAALYSEPLLDTEKVTITTPLPAATWVDGKLTHRPIRTQDYLFVKTIKDNRAAGSVDRISTNNGRLLFECVWAQADDGQWMCIFALNL